MSFHFRLGNVRQWHWISSALCLAGMLLFALTGITLNHAGQIESQPRIVEHEDRLPESLHRQLKALAPADEAGRVLPLPASLRTWLKTELGVDIPGRNAEWQRGEIYLPMPRPGGDAWLSIDLTTGELLYEQTDRGWVSYFNDLHKGRNTGAAWSWFIDLFSVACVVFCITGLLLLHRHAGARPTTWPLLGLGLVIPLLLALLFIH